MYLLIIWIIATVLAVIITIKIDEEDSIAGLIFGSIIFYFIVVGCLRLNYASVNNLDVTEYKPLLIASLTQDKETKLNGDFILGCGSISGVTNDYYITYGKYVVGLKRIKLDAYNTYLEKSNSEVPKIKNYYIRIIKKEFKSKWFWNRKETIEDWTKYIGELYMVVPTNTIKIEGTFNIDH
jgi:hypothetical protein